MLIASALASVFIGTMGQSDAVGAHAVDALTRKPPYPTQALMLNDTWGTRGPTDYLYSAYQTAGVTRLVPAIETKGPTPPLLASIQYGETHVTSMMAQQIFEGSPQTYIGRSDAAPGRPIASLMLGTQTYFNALQDLTKANALVTKGGGSLVEPALAFINGQSDRELKTDPATYCSESSALARTWSADAREITGQAAPVIFFQMQLAAPHAGAADVAAGVGSLISQCEMDLAISNPLFRLAAPSYMFVFTLDGGLHFNAAGQRLQGEYLGKAMYQEFRRHKHWEPLYPKSIVYKASDHTRIEVTLNVPVGPIVRDTTGIAQGAAPFDGFTFHDACSDAKVIGDTITGGGTVEIRLSAAPKCAKQTLDYAYDFVPGVHPSIYSSTWGNIRDSDKTKGWAGETLYNWLVIFSMPVT